MNRKRVFLDLHIIQTMPPSNINRDDTGSPKTAQYGGVRRARVSSQAWKKAMREYFVLNGAKENVGVRTLELADYVKEQIMELDKSIEDSKALEMAVIVLEKAGIKLKDGKVKALFFIGHKQAMGLAKAALDEVNDRKELQKILADNVAIDIAMFGRMVADEPALNEDASSQVAHAISTHAVQTEFDFFTAVDDKKPIDSTGAGMLGTVEYNSSTLYRYANLALHELIGQLGDKNAAIEASKLFVKAFANSMPTGKVNTFANQTMPQLILVNIRDDRPVNLVTAFEAPIKSNNGYVDQSIRKLIEEDSKVSKFIEKPTRSYYLSTVETDVDTSSVIVSNFEEIFEKLDNDLEEILDEVGE